jgi:hypothetical protein
MQFGINYSNGVSLGLINSSYIGNNSWNNYSQYEVTFTITGTTYGPYIYNYGGASVGNINVTQGSFNTNTLTNVGDTMTIQPSFFDSNGTDLTSIIQLISVGDGIEIHKCNGLTPTPTPTSTVTPTPTETEVIPETPTPTPTETVTPTVTPTITPTSETPTPTPTVTPTETVTPTPTPTSILSYNYCIGVGYPVVNCCDAITVYNESCPNNEEDSSHLYSNCSSLDVGCIMYVDSALSYPYGANWIYDGVSCWLTDETGMITESGSCVTPTPTPTETVTPTPTETTPETPTPTPTATPTPTVTPTSILSYNYCVGIFGSTNCCDAIVAYNADCPSPPSSTHIYSTCSPLNVGCVMYLEPDLLYPLTLDTWIYDGTTCWHVDITGTITESGSCVTPTPTPTETVTPTVTPTITPTPETPTPTPTETVTPTPTPSMAAFYAYIFAEPQNSTDDTDLLNFATTGGAIDWYSYYSSTVPNNNSGSYSNDLDVYAHQPSFINGTGDFVKPDDLKAPIAQVNGQIINGLSQSIYTFGSIEVNSSIVTPSEQYFYTIWIPLNGVNGSLTDMTIDVGTNLGGDEIYSNIGTIVGTTALNVTVTSGAAIPAGTYRVLWVSPQFILPTLTPLSGSLYFRGDTKS